MSRFVCVTCGTRFSESEQAPEACPICEDERQFVPRTGQRWTTDSALANAHAIAWSETAPGIHALEVAVPFGIGQRAFFIERAEGNILWDCLSLIDETTAERIRAAGGLSAIAISHPHFYTANAEWSAAFGNVPVHLHAADAQWVQEPHAAIRHWDGERMEIAKGATLIRCGGHFEGSAVLHVADGDGALFTGDTLQVVPDRKHVGFMRSYPNLIPLPASTVEHIAAAVRPFRFNSVFGGFAGRTIETDGNAAVERSAERYVAAIQGAP